jgi:hypothetical protein
MIVPKIAVYSLIGLTLSLSATVAFPQDSVKKEASFQSTKKEAVPGSFTPRNSYATIWKLLKDGKAYTSEFTGCIDTQGELVKTAGTEKIIFNEFSQLEQYVISNNLVIVQNNHSFDITDFSDKSILDRNGILFSKKEGKWYAVGNKTPRDANHLGEWLKWSSLKIIPALEKYKQKHSAYPDLEGTGSRWMNWKKERAEVTDLIEFRLFGKKQSSDFYLRGFEYWYNAESYILYPDYWSFKSLGDRTTDFIKSNLSKEEIELKYWKDIKQTFINYENSFESNKHK